MNLVWQQWLLLGWYLLTAILTVATIGRAKPVTTPGMAAFSIVILVILGVLVFTI